MLYELLFSIDCIKHIGINRPACHMAFNGSWQYVGGNLLYVTTRKQQLLIITRNQTLLFAREKFSANNFWHFDFYCVCLYVSAT